MARKNRNLAMKADKAKRERIEYVRGEEMRETMRPILARDASPIVATHWGLGLAPITREEIEAATARAIEMGRLRKLPRGEYNRRQCGLARW
jgi:hypothetical protein